MLFNSVQFAVFFAAVLAAFFLVARPLRLQVLLGASLLFYALWVPAYLALLLAMLLFNHWAVRQMVRSASPRRWLSASIAFTLAMLGLFKYSALLVETALPALRLLTSATTPQPPDWVLPLGISFYSFEIISLSVDIHRGRLPVPSFARYALFVTFFPHLIAGPIMRGEELLPQFERGGAPSAERARRGVWLFASGLLKKTVLADFLLAPFVDDVFAEPGAASASAHLLAAYGFAFQIYFDFSGYTDMARGLACVLGFELPHNFLEPYLSRSPSEFWRRWHITLSRWLRDYLYIPLGGNRRGPLRTLVNLLVTMLLGGLWHGAGWNFVLWGGLHGLLLGAERLTGRGRVTQHDRFSLADVPRALLLFHVVCLVWVPFRAPTVDGALQFWRALFAGGYDVSWPVLPAAAVLLSACLHVAERGLRRGATRLRSTMANTAWGPAVEGFSLGVILMAALVCSGGSAEFIYFQF